MLFEIKTKFFLIINRENANLKIINGLFLMKLIFIIKRVFKWFTMLARRSQIQKPCEACMYQLANRLRAEFGLFWF